MAILKNAILRKKGDPSLSDCWVTPFYPIKTGLVNRREGVAFKNYRFFLGFSHGIARLEDDGNDDLFVRLILILTSYFVGGGDDSFVILFGADVEASGCVDDSVSYCVEDNTGSFAAGNGNIGGGPIAADDRITAAVIDFAARCEAESYAGHYCHSNQFKGFHDY